jgi:hypothetical protein
LVYYKGSRFEESEVRGTYSTHEGNDKCINSLIRKLEEQTSAGGKGTNERIILKLILKNRVLGCSLDSSGSGQGPVAGCCEHGEKPSGSTKGREFINQMIDYQLLKEDCTVWC